MAIYRTVLLTLIERLRQDSPAIMQPWYVEDAAIMGKAQSVAGYFELLRTLGIIPSRPCLSTFSLWRMSWRPRVFLLPTISPADSVVGIAMLAALLA